MGYLSDWIEGEREAAEAVKRFPHCTVDRECTAGADLDEHMLACPVRRRAIRVYWLFQWWATLMGTRDLTREPAWGPMRYDRTPADRIEAWLADPEYNPLFRNDVEIALDALRSFEEG